MLAPGQKQRLGLARALILRPKVIICDEALASLDMSMRSQLINLMLELQEKGNILHLCHPASGDDEAYQRSGAGDA